MTQEERNPHKIRKQVEVWTQDYEWFKRTHGDASISWIVNILLHAYRTVCENKSVEDPTPIALAETAGSQIKEEIEDGLHQE